MECGIVLAEFGEREKQIREFVKNVRKVSGLPIVIFSDRPYTNLGEGVLVRVLPVESCHWQGHRRYFNRNNDFWKVQGVLQTADDFDVVLVLDDDMRIVHKDFMEGFELAEKFGLCLPMNPRVYFGIDREVGDDVSPDVMIDTKDCPYGMTANNMGVIFLNNLNNRAMSVLERYLSYMENHPCRGPVAMAVSCWRERFGPYFLPEEWCACGGYTQFKQRSGKRINPMFLHVGHPDVNQWFQTEPVFSDFR